jgi:hypothetical protein
VQTTADERISHIRAYPSHPRFKPAARGAQVPLNCVLCKVLVFSGFKSHPATGRSSR